MKISLLYLEVQLQPCAVFPELGPDISGAGDISFLFSLLLYVDACTPSVTELNYIAQDDDAVNAEIFIKKASFLVNNCKDEALNLQYKVC